MPERHRTKVHIRHRPRYTLNMEVTLTAYGEELLHSVLARHPAQSAAEAMEQALASLVQQERLAAASPGHQSRPEFQDTLDNLTVYSDNVPLLLAEAFSRESFYQDHD